MIIVFKQSKSLKVNIKLCFAGQSLNFTEGGATGRGGPPQRGGWATLGWGVKKDLNKRKQG